MEKAVYSEALATFGFETQINKAIEECAEFIVAARHYLSGRQGSAEALVEEIADVEIMLDQMRLIFGEKCVEAVKRRKLARLADRVSQAARGNASLVEGLRVRPSRIVHFDENPTPEGIKAAYAAMKGVIPHKVAPHHLKCDFCSWSGFVTPLGGGVRCGGCGHLYGLVIPEGAE